MGARNIKIYLLQQIMIVTKTELGAQSLGAEPTATSSVGTNVYDFKGAHL